MPYTGEYFDVRLVDGPSEADGTLQLFALGEWRTLCMNSYEVRSIYSDMICKQLDFDAAIEFNSSTDYVYSRENFNLQDIRCDGTETYLWQCQHDLRTDDYIYSCDTLSIRCFKVKGKQRLLILCS